MNPFTFLSELGKWLSDNSEWLFQGAGVWVLGGIAAALVRAACDWAAHAGFEEVTLTTFREVRWNMPFYAKLGFVEVPAARLDAELETIVRDEEARGLPRDRRAVMRYALCDRPLQAKSGASDEDAR